MEQYPTIDAVVMLVGINDLSFRLAYDTAYQPLRRASGADHRAFVKAFAKRPGWNPTWPWYQRTHLWQRIHTAMQRLTAPADSIGALVQDSVGQNYVRWREHRAAAPRIRDTLPDLTTALAEYADNLRTIVELAAARSIRTVLVTQPSMFRPDLSPEVEGLLWAGGVGEYQQESGSEYYSVGALARGMAAYNRVLLEICEQHGAECVDLASQLTRDTSTMYDDMHFNENGARQVARIVARALPPVYTAGRPD